jgi:hypothetical protein
MNVLQGLLDLMTLESMGPLHGCGADALRPIQSLRTYVMAWSRAGASEEEL